MDESTLQETARAFKRYRALAKRRFNREDYAGTLSAVQEWYRWMYDHPDSPFPDDWADMQRYEQDAEMKLRHKGIMLTF